MRILFLLFIIMPIVEMFLLIKVGAWIGAWYTIALVLLTAMIGITLLRHQGLQTLVNANQKMRSGEMPVSEMGEGVMLAVAGALLLTPGFVTDTIGFLLLTPGVRQLLVRAMVERLVKAGGVVQGNVYYSSYSEVRPESESGKVIEGDFRELDKSDREA